MFRLCFSTQISIIWLQIKYSYTIVGCELLTHCTIDVDTFMGLTKITVIF